MSSASESPRGGRRITAQDRLHKLLHKKLGIPRSATEPVLAASRIARSPGGYRRRKRMAEGIAAAGDPLLRIPAETGHRFFGPGHVPGTLQAADYCEKLFREARGDCADEDSRSRKRFVRSVLEGTDFCRHPELLRFMVSRPFVDAAAVHLRTVPRLAGARLWWSPPTETAAASSQLFHLDYEDRTQVKVFLNVLETREDQGPLTFLPANVSERVRRSLPGLTARMEDEVVHEAGGRDCELRLVGPAGSGVLLDSSRCLHYGSRLNRRGRLLLIFQFLKVHTAYRATGEIGTPRELPGWQPDPVQALVLGVGG